MGDEMRLKELIGKEIVNISDGFRLGVIGDSDLLIDPHTGKIEAILIPDTNAFWSSWFESKSLTIPWTAIKKIGKEIIVVEIPQKN
jgi:YlmC/YmxH family sporulation protein